MEKKKHKFFWEDENYQKGHKHHENRPSHKVHNVTISRPVSAPLQRKPFAFGFGFMFPKMHEISRSDIAIRENEKEVIVTAMLPGFSKEDVAIDVNQNYVRIRAEKKKSAKHKSDSSSFSMEQMSCIERTASLPDSVEPQHAKIDFAHGIMTITIPRAKKKKFSLFQKK